MEDPVIIVGAGNKVGGILYDTLGIFHSYAKTGIFNHGYIVITVSAADHLVCSHSDAVQQLLQGIGLIDLLGHNLQKEGLGTVYVQESVKTFFQRFHHLFHDVRIPGSQQLINREIQGVRQNQGSLPRAFC